MIRRTKNQHSYNGYELEQKFYEWIEEYRGYNGEGEKTFEILCLDWMSRVSKGEYDFCMKVCSPRRYILVDIVGTYENDGVLYLNTSHKNWENKLKVIQEPDEGYLAFLVNGLWRYIRITNDLPAGDIRMTSGRMKHIRTAETVYKCDPVMPFPDDLPNEDLLELEKYNDRDDVIILIYQDENGKNRIEMVKPTPL